MPGLARSYAGVMVTLNGSGSSDPDGSIANYAWTQTAGTPAVTLSSSTAVQADIRGADRHAR